MKTNFKLKRKNPFLLLMTFLLFSLYFSNAFAQSIVNVVDLTTTSLNVEQEACVNQFENEVDVLSFTVIELGHIPMIQQNGILSINIPDNPTTYEFKGRYVNVAENNDYTWVGNLMTCEDTTAENSCSYGRISILKKGDRHFGEWYVDTTFYRIRSLGGGLSALIEIDQYYHQDQMGCPMGDNSGGIETNTLSNENDPEPTVSARDVIPCPVECLVLYTEAAFAASPDIKDVIDEAILHTNTFLQNSKIAPYQLKIHLAGVQPLTDEEWEEKGDRNIDPSDIAINEDIMEYRDQYDADIVIVLTDDVYPKISGVVTDFGDDPSDVINAFGIVEVQFTNGPEYTFQHEVAHLFGARHEGRDLCPGDGDDSGLANAHGFLFDWGCNCWIFGSKRPWKTIMASCTNVSLIPRVPAYSTPKVRFPFPNFGKPIGIAGSNDNARVLRGAACRISDYVWSDHPTVIIGADVDGCPDEVISATANVQGVPPPHVYEWRTSTDGVDWSSVVSTDFAYLLTLPNEAGEVVHLQLKAGTAGGSLATAVHSILVIDDEHACFREQKGQSINEQTINHPTQKLIAYPNPTDKNLTIFINGLNEKKYQVDLFDISGNKLLTLDGRKIEEDQAKLHSDVSDLSVGMYILRCKGKKFNEIIRFVIGK